MKKILYTLLLSFWAVYSFGQGNIATLLTKTAKAGNSRLLYAQNKTGDSLAVYVVAEDVINTATLYHLSISSKQIYLVAQPVYTGQQSADSVQIAFNDVDHMVLINNHDRYRLHPGFYTQFKQAVWIKHSVMTVLELLQDNIGDYPIGDALPLLLFHPQKEKHIQQATITTTRSQSDLTDTWNCIYRYDKHGYLSSVNAADGKIMRFSKKINYKDNRVLTVRTYNNLEDRQITERTITYSTTNMLKWQDIITETGKNRRTAITFVVSKKKPGHVEQVIMPQAEVIRLVKSK